MSSPLASIVTLVILVFCLPWDPAATVGAYQCGGTVDLNDTSGMITSPNYPRSYLNNMNCVWLFNVPEEATLIFSLNPPFRLEAGYDYLNVYETSQTGLEKVMVSWPSDNLTEYSSGNDTTKVKLEFTTDSSNVYNGFNLTWELIQNDTNEIFPTIDITMPFWMTKSTTTPSTIWTTSKSTTDDPYQCGGRVDVNATTGVITSPNYPNSYRNNMHCEWYFFLPEGAIVNFSVTPPFDLENGYDKLEVKQGNPFNWSNVTTAPWTGSSSVTRTLRTTVGMTQVYLDFTTDHSAVRSGFNVTWTVLNMDCSRTFSKGSRSLTPKRSGRDYRNSLDCEWIIDAQANEQIHLTFGSTFDIESSNDGNCSYDYLEVFDISPVGDLVKRGRFCGSQAPPSLISSSWRMMVRFHSDEEKAGKGFYLTWNFYKRCGGNVNIKSIKGVIELPSHPGSLAYHYKMECHWFFELPPKMSIKLTFPSSEDWTDKYQSLQVIQKSLSGGSRSSRTWRDDSVPEVFTTNSYYRKLEMILNANGSHIASEFHATWEIVIDYCKDGFSSTTGNLTSMNFGDEYLNNLDCEWVINGGRNHVVHLYFDNLFDVESSNDGDCTYDYLELLDYTPSGRFVSKGRYCGNESPPDFISSRDRVMVRFHTDHDKGGAGFSLSWDTSCGDVYDDLQGNVTSPLYPRPYPDRFDCRWEIVAPAGYVIKLKFSEPFHIEFHDQCETDYLEIFDYTNTSSLVSKGKWCGASLPPEQTSMTSRMLLIFHSDNAKSYTGFKAEWNSEPTTKCGDVFNLSQGSFTSPGFPTSYPDNLDCRWEINVAEGQRLMLEFGSIFELEKDNTGKCYDEIEILDTLSNGTMISEGIWCSMPKRQVFYSSSSQIVVTFRSDLDKGERGFLASWRTVSGCGGTFTAENGHIDSPNFPDDYPANKQCRWEIIPPEGRNVTLRFDNLFDVEVSNRCSWDFVQIRLDGWTKGKWCGTQPPPDVVFRGGQRLEVIFRSDKSTFGKGFYASWKSEEN